jgi:hypothetical protein
MILIFPPSSAWTLLKPMPTLWGEKDAPATVEKPAGVAA